MPKVTIVRPNNTPEQEKKALENIASALGGILEEKYGVKVKVNLRFKDRRKKAPEENEDEVAQ